MEGSHVSVMVMCLQTFGYIVCVKTNIKNTSSPGPALTIVKYKNASSCTTTYLPQDVALWSGENQAPIQISLMELSFSLHSYSAVHNICSSE